MLLFLIIIALIIAIFAVVFAIQNANIIFVSFLVWRFQGSLALILLLTFVLGFIVGLLVLMPKLMKRRFLFSNQKKKFDEAQEGLEGEDEFKNIIK